MATEVREKMVPEDTTELRELETENNIFNQSFVKVAEKSATKVKAAEAARIRVSETAQVNAQTQTLG